VFYWSSTRAFLKHFINPTSWFLKVKTKLDANYVAISLGYNDYRMYSMQTHFKVNGTETQLSVTAILTTLIHNKLTLWYIVAHTCIISS
jgi:hypothetical protein